MERPPTGPEIEELAAQLRRAGSVFAEDEAALLLREFEGNELAEAVLARCEGEPLEQIVGWALFAGVRIAVHPGVFVPRRRTELLLELALSRLPRHGVLVEMCCGAAPVATAVATARSDVRVHACDLLPASVLCALENLAPLGGTALAGDLADGVPEELDGRVDVLVANAPYVPSAQLSLMPREARVHEPVVALDGGDDGTRVQARVAELAPGLLRPGGVLLVETSRPQAARTAEIVEAAGMLAVVHTDDELDGTAVSGVLPETD